MKPVNAKDWLSRYEDELGSPYERMFVETVLANVKGLDFSSLTPQLRFVDSDGKNRFTDFAIQEGEVIKIAIEVDGYDKRGTGTGMSKRDFVDWQRRHAALVAQEGWDVLRFANTDVRDHPSRCINHIELLLRTERRKSEHQRHLAETIEELNRKFEAANTRQDASDEQNRLRKEISTLKQQLALAKESKPLNNKENARLEELNEYQKRVSVLNEENRTMKTAIWAFAAILIAIILAVAYVAGNALSHKPHADPEFIATSEKAPHAEQELIATSEGAPHAEATTVPPGSSCENPVSWENAKNYKGQNTSFRGKVVSFVTKENLKGQPTWINVGRSFPEKKRLQLTIWGRDLDKFEHLLPQLKSKIACITGEVSVYKGVPQITIQGTEQLQIL